MHTKKTEIEALKVKAENGDIEAQYSLGSYYLSEGNNDESIKWHTLSAEQGNHDSQYELGFLYERLRDIDSATKWFKCLMNNESASMFIRAAAPRFIGDMYFERESSFDDYLTSMGWYGDAMDMGDGIAPFKLGEIYENGLRSYLKNQDLWPSENLLIGPDLYYAADLYLKSAEAGWDKAQLKYAEWCYSGKGGVTKNYKKAFKWMFIAACKNLPEAKVNLVDFYINGIGIEKNIREAYIWALLAKDKYDPDKIHILEQQLTKQDMYDAQDEAEVRLQMLEGHGHARASLYDYLLDKLNKNDASASSETDDADESYPNKKKPKKQISLIDWNVSDIGKVIIHINQKEKTIVVRYGKKKHRFSITELFSPSCKQLLIDFDKHANDPHEPAIPYQGKSINRTFDLERSNQGVVSDFNSKFRKLFGLEKQVKAFTWLPGTKGRKQDKSLKIHFQLKVNYRV